MSQPSISTRQAILEEAIQCTCTDRNLSYGEPEENLANIAEYWRSYLGQKYKEDVVINARDVAWMMVLMKIARDTHSNKHDNAVDAAAYSAIAGELA